MSDLAHRLDALRDLVGANKEMKSKVAGAVGSTFDAQRKRYEEEMQRLAKGGADYSGRDIIRQALRRAGRKAT